MNEVNESLSDIGYARILKNRISQFLATHDQFQKIEFSPFLPSADSKAVCRRLRKHFLLQKAAATS
jgi:hypothetical protein